VPVIAYSRRAGGVCYRRLGGGQNITAPNRVKPPSSGIAIGLRGFAELVVHVGDRPVTRGGFGLRVGDIGLEPQPVVVVVDWPTIVSGGRHSATAPAADPMPRPP